MQSVRAAVHNFFDARIAGDAQLNKLVLPRVIRPKRRLRFLVGLAITAFGAARMGYLAWPMALDVFNATLHQLA